MPEESPVPGTEMKLRPELMLAVCRALNFDPGEFARRHAREFTRCYLRATPGTSLLPIWAAV